MHFIPRPAKVFYGWYIVGACSLITLYTGGIVHLGFTAVFEPIAEEFSWSYAQISLAASLRGLEIGLLAPVMGLFVDRWGPRRLIFGGSILVFIGFALMSRISSLAMLYLAFAFIATGTSTCTQTVTMTAVGNWFRRKAGMATGIVASGFGLGGLLVPVVTVLIYLLEWRMAMLTLGLGMLVIVSPLSLLVRHKPEHYGYQPDGDMSSAVEEKGVPISAASTEINISAKQALSNRIFWAVAFASTFYMFSLNAVTIHIMPYLSSLGIGRNISSLIALVLPITSIFGRLGSGWLSDRLNRKHAFTASFVLVTAGLLLFEYIIPGRTLLLILFIATFGLGWGSFATTRVALQREYFGRSNFGTILGFTSGIMMLGNLAGPPLVGLVFDTWGSYQGAWLGCAALTAIAIVLSLAIPTHSSNIRPQANR